MIYLGSPYYWVQQLDMIEKIEAIVILSKKEAPLTRLHI